MSWVTQGSELFLRKWGAQVFRKEEWASSAGPKCSGELKIRYFQFTDPDVPLATCTWVIEAPLHQQVEITVWAFQLHSQDCNQNYLEFQDPPEVTIV